MMRCTDIRPRRVAGLAAGGAGLLVLAPSALGHVEVLPTQATVNEAQEFTVRVPTERAIPTVGVRVMFPSQVDVFSFQPPPPGWRMHVITSRNQTIRGVSYTGGRIGVSQYQDFRFLGTPTAQGQTLWRAYQTYADGKVKPWTAKPEARGAVSVENGPTQRGPASAVEVVAAGAATGSDTATTSSDSGGDHSEAAVYLGIIAIGIAALAALGTGLLWSTRPAKLPPDDPGEGA
jgi:uncharacterized protein YcnI